MFGRANSAEHRRENLLAVHERRDAVAGDKIWPEQRARGLSKFRRARGIKRRDFVARLFAGFKSAARHEEAKAARNQNRRRQLAVSAARKRRKQTRHFHNLIINSPKRQMVKTYKLMDSTSYAAPSGLHSVKYT
jgi:hypothetical protein